MSFPIGTESGNAVSTALKKGRTGWTCGNPNELFGAGNHV